MELCKECHYKNENPDLCNFNIPPEEKPSAFNSLTSCGRFLRESKWQRLGEEQRKYYEQRHERSSGHKE
nr:MAG TPA: hypothetical protein [Caudoviricetes sp.]